MRPRPRSPAPRRRRGSIIDLVGADRDQVIPILKESFTGYYRWHAKRQLREVPTVRALRVGAEWWGATELDRLAPEVGYVYYVFTGRAHRRQGVAAALLDDALRSFRAEGAAIVYAVVGTTNRASLGLFRSRGFRPVRDTETNWRDGGLGAWGLRSRMRIIAGERLLARRLVAPAAPATTGARRRTAGPRPTRPRRRSRGSSTVGCR
jgi:ribosomal protein S18 acetylase RimI-like enzyme